jgi:hypothetical protein
MTRRNLDATQASASQSQGIGSRRMELALRQWRNYGSRTARLSAPKHVAKAEEEKPAEAGLTGIHTLVRVARTNSVCRDQFRGFHGEMAAASIWNAI